MFTCPISACFNHSPARKYTPSLVEIREMVLTMSTDAAECKRYTDKVVYKGRKL
jgi:hypothetical protein